MYLAVVRPGWLCAICHSSRDFQKTRPPRWISLVWSGFGVIVFSYDFIMKKNPRIANSLITVNG
jgi:hypothetical protein